MLLVIRETHVGCSPIKRVRELGSNRSYKITLRLCQVIDRCNLRENVKSSTFAGLRNRLISEKSYCFKTNRSKDNSEGSLPFKFLDFKRPIHIGLQRKENCNIY